MRTSISRIAAACLSAAALLTLPGLGSAADRPLDRDDNPPGPRGGPGTNWENPPGRRGGPGATPDRQPDRQVIIRRAPQTFVYRSDGFYYNPSFGYYHPSYGFWNEAARCWYDNDDNPPGPRGGPGTNWENPPGLRGGPGTSPDRYGRCA